MTLLLAVGALALIVGGYFLVSSLTSEDEPQEEDGGTAKTQFLQIDGELTKIDYTYGGERVVLEKNGEEIDLRAEDDEAPEGELESEYIGSERDFSVGGFTLEDDDGNPIPEDENLFEEEEVFQEDEFAETEEDF